MVWLFLGAQVFMGCSSPFHCDQVHVKVRMVDDETGEPVSRNGNYVHASNDAEDVQVSLEPGYGDRFELCIAHDNIRLRIPDRTDTYSLFEENFGAVDGVLDIEVRLKPTHWVRLHGTIQWEDSAGKRSPLHKGDGNVRKASIACMVRNASTAYGGANLSPSDDGQYSKRVPREFLDFLTLNTSYDLSPAEVDLSEVPGDDFEVNFIFKPGASQDH